MLRGRSEVDAGGRRTVTVWTIDLAREAGAGDEAMLDERERARAASMVPEVRRRFVVAHASAREALAAHLQVPAAEVAFATAAGKPRLATGALRFNLSHSGEIGLLAVADGVEVGVDVERVRARPRTAGVERRLFSDAERAALAGAPADRRDELFHRLWVRREAYVKATGAGVAALAEVDALSWPPPGWRGCDLAAPAGYVAAVVAEA